MSSDARSPILSEEYLHHASELVAEADNDPWGAVSPSVYETARVVSWAPWSAGQAPRVAWLLDQQDRDGTWGYGPAPYRLLPTLSAVEALLTLVRDRTEDAGAMETASQAATEGLDALDRLCAGTGPWPDTAAIELLVPSLIALINDHLDHLAAGPERPSLDRADPVRVPHGFTAHAPEAVAGRARSGSLPVKLQHTLEGVAAHLDPAALPTGIDGLMGSSPAATAACAATIGTAAARQQAEARLAEVAARYEGLFIEAAPFITVERLWIVGALTGPTPPAEVLPTLGAWARDIHDSAGVRGAPGLMVDADDTALSLIACAATGTPSDLAALKQFAAEDHYDCYRGEDTGSVTANAHALIALAAVGEHDPAWIRSVSGWLMDQQQRDGHWTDKWHASPYYATSRSVSALTAHAATNGDRGEEALRAAVRWTLETQRADGSWGIWEATAEETAYAAKILLTAGRHAQGQQTESALRRARAFLDEPRGERAHPPMWQDKTLYAPIRIIDAEIIAVRELLARHRATAGE